MNSPMRIAAQLLIGVFFFWHVAAVGIYAIPMGTQDTIAKPVRNFMVSKVFAPYILITSQWQQWNLFSPDPLRRVSRYRIQRQLPDGQWKTLETIVPGTYEWWRHATHFKMLIGMLEKDQETFREPLLRHFLLMRCESFELPAETPLRLAYAQYVVSPAPSAIAAMHPDPWPPSYFLTITDPSYCP